MRCPPLSRAAYLFAVCAAGAIFGSDRAAYADQIFWTKETLLKDFFKHSERVSYVRVEGESAKRELVAQLGYAPEKSSYVVFVARTGANIDGYAVIDEQQGEHLPITFGVRISPARTVERFEVLVYREAYGSEVKEPRFSRQFVGKNERDPLRVGDDISAVSGATISSRAMAVGIKRALVLVSLAEKAMKTPNVAGSPAEPAGGSTRDALQSSR
jgi:hypothetical protein